MKVAESRQLEVILGGRQLDDFGEQCEQRDDGTAICARGLSGDFQVTEREAGGSREKPGEAGGSREKPGEAGREQQLITPRGNGGD
uniref:Uncharacterized protein n=1 Tax=Globodera rostochiensis TaxID=31243 RepID=A0A914GWS9_GLORO